MTKIIILIITVFMADPAKKPSVTILPMHSESECRYYAHLAHEKILAVPNVNAVATTCVIHQNLLRD